MARRLLWIGCLALVAGCAARSPTPVLWQLEPQAAMPAAWNPGAPVVYVGAVDLPRYLDRPEVIQRAGPGRLEPEALNRWAEPLDDGITRVLGEELARRLASENVVTYPVQARLPVDYRVILDLDRFDGRVDSEVALVARWTIVGGASGDALAVGREDIAVAAEGGMEGFIQAHDEALSELAARITAAIEALAAEQPQAETGE